jgi:hypothetical protein
MKTRLVLQLALGLWCVLPGGLREAAVYGQTPSGYQPASQPAESPGQRLYQEVIVTQKSVCRVQGLDSRYELRYAVLSSLDLNQRNDGSLEVKQKVAAAKLLEADEATRALFGSLVQKLPGATFTMRFGPQGELVRFEGAQDKVQRWTKRSSWPRSSTVMAGRNSPDIASSSRRSRCGPGPDGSRA